LVVVEVEDGDISARGEVRYGSDPLILVHGHNKLSLLFYTGRGHFLSDREEYFLKKFSWTLFQTVGF
jgi:hypothetical protein